MPEFDGDTSAGYLVKRVQQALRRRSDAALRDTGLSMAQYAVLRALADHPRASAAELARRCFVTRQSLHDLLTALRAARLVESVGAPQGRAQALRLTAAGRARLRSAHAAVLAVEELMMDGIGAKDRNRLIAGLSRCAQNLESATR